MAQRVQRCSVGCSVAQLVVRWPAVRQARVQISARHPREVFPTEHKCYEEMERGLGEWRWTTVPIVLLYECDSECMYSMYKDKINKKFGNRKKKELTCKETLRQVFICLRLRT